MLRWPRMIDPSVMATFAAVVENSSITGAARRLGVTKSAVSKQLARLEDSIGIRLLYRTTRKLSVTAAGAAFYDKCARLVSDVEEAEALIGEFAGEPRGLLRCSVPVGFGQRFVAPEIPALLLRHPALRVELALDDRVVDLIGERHDVAIRIGTLRDSTLVGRKLGSVRRVLCGSPDYLARRGTPKRPRDLLTHDCLRYTYLSPASEWRFRRGRGEQTLRVAGSFSSNNGMALCAAAAHGQGLTMLPEFYAAEELRDGRLVELLKEHQLPPIGVYAVHPQARHAAPKVRAFIEHLVDRFHVPPWRCDKTSG